MNHIRLIERAVAFAPFAHEQTVVFPLNDRVHLEFLWFQLHGSPASREGMPRGIFPHSARAYIDGIEVTRSIVIELKKKLSAKPVAQIQAQYRAGMDAWLRLARAYGAGYPGNAANDEARAAVLATDPDPASLLTMLGDNQVGSGGCLHIFNYLYHCIDIDPVSMWDLVNTHNSSGATPIDVKASVSPKLTLSSGPCRLFDAGFDPVQYKGQGALMLRLVLSYHDPLEDQLAELKRQLDRLQRQILARLDTISDACRDGGPFQLAIANLKGAVAGLQQDVSSMRADVASNTAQAAALQAQAKALQDAVNQL